MSAGRRRPGGAAIADAIRRAGGAAFTRGVVTSTSPLLVAVAGSTPAVALKRMASYTPGLNDHVLIAIADDGDLVVLGEFA